MPKCYSTGTMDRLLDLLMGRDASVQLDRAALELAVATGSPKNVQRIREAGGEAIFVPLDVSDESHGNIVGIGLADLTTERLVARMDPEPFRINVLTSCCLERARIPITLPTDRDVMAAALDTCWRIDPLEARVVIIPNTLELTTLWVSPALEAEVAAHPHLDRETEYLPMPFSMAK